MSDARCGTPSGYRRHQRLDETPCNACAAAKAKYDVNWRNTRDDGIRKNRASAAAQQRAHAALARAHKDEYDALYAKHKAEVFIERGLA